MLDIIDAFSDVTVGVLGDFMLDKYCDCTVERISPEAPCLVLIQESERVSPGGAGNAAANVAALGAKCHVYGLIGNDVPGSILKASLSLKEIEERGLIQTDALNTICKTRYVTDSYQHIRIDTDHDIMPEFDDDDIVGYVVNQLEKDVAVGQLDALLISDYDKGLLNEDRIRTIIELCVDHEIPVIVDPKFKNFLHYVDCSLLKCNVKEAAAILDMKPEDLADEPLLLYGIMESLRCSGLVMTEGRHGMTILRQDGDSLMQPAETVDVADLAGAGDTVAAVFAIAAGVSDLDTLDFDLFTVARLANVAASVVVQKRGTAVCTADELRKAIGEKK